MMKTIGHCCLIAIVMAACGFVSVSCDKSDPDNSIGPNGKTRGIKLNVTQTSEFVETKAGNNAKLNNVSGSEEDGLVIEEYVSDMDGNMPETKGWEIKTDNIVSKYGAFNVMAFLDTLDKDKNTVHVNEFNLTSRNGGSGWAWAGYAAGDGPKWRTSTATTMWSYAPTSLSLTADDNVTDGTQGWADGEYGKLTFSHTVPVGLTDQQDLIFAFNNEMRDFKKDAKGNYIKDANGDLQFETGQDEYVDIHFYHALAAVKFELTTSTISAGANVHSITLCYMDSDKNIVKEVGFARYGKCTVTGDDSDSGSCAVSFDWSNLGTKRPLHYTYADTYSTPADPGTVAGGYASSGQGVMFMIPQTIQHSITTPEGKTATLKIIVEFSKYGSSRFYTVVKDFTNQNITWDAGKYYLYKLGIGEFHVPGENYTDLTDVEIDGLKNSSGFIRPESARLSTKGVTKVGLVLNSWRLGSKDGQTVYLNGIKDGVDQVPAIVSGNVPSSLPSNPTFTFNFASVSENPLPNTNNMIYSFGTDSTEETYSKYYSFSPPTGSGKSKLGTPKIGPFYYVFDCSGASGFQVIFKPSASDNSGGFFADVRCMLVLEVREDPNLPTNWDDFLSNSDDYLL